MDSNADYVGPSAPGYGGSHQPQPQQPQQQQQQVVIINNQPGAPTQLCQPQNVREWSTGLFGCFDDCGSCMHAYFCFSCFVQSLAFQLNECTCGPSCFGRVFTVAMRTKIRSMYGIRGSILQDCCYSTFCEFCTATQMQRELLSLGYRRSA